MRILITTDNHVGYNEHDPIRGDDAANTFDEILALAEANDVDFVLQGGDLFHHNKPSKRSVYQVVKSLRERCLGDKPIRFQLLHHGRLSLDEELDYPNYSDENINIAIPVFAISGNHDDRGGAVLMSPLDMLACTGLMNYFGRVLDHEDIEVVPLIFQQDGTNVAVYGLSNVRDERLHRAFRDNRVNFVTPPDVDSYYNILMVHQNRSAHTETNYLPESFLPTFIDTVIWGHEHECLIDPQINPTMGFQVIQPGSSVATSLCEGEQVPKHVAILDIQGKECSIEKLPLKTVRPFAMSTVAIRDSGIAPSSKCMDEVVAWMEQQVEQLIEQALSDWRIRNPDATETPLPLVRLRVDYTGFPVENPTRFSNRFAGRIANANDVVQYTKKKAPAARPESAVLPDQLEDKVQLSQLVHEFLQKQSLQIIPEDRMTESIAHFVDKDDKQALKLCVEKAIKGRLTEKNSESRNSSSPRVVPEPTLFVDGGSPPRQTSGSASVALDSEDSDFMVDSDEDPAPKKQKTLPRDSKRANNPAELPRTRASAKQTTVSERSVETPRKRPRARARASDKPVESSGGADKPARAKRQKKATAVPEVVTKQVVSARAESDSDDGF